MAARAILGALRSTPVEHLNAFASLTPIKVLMNEVCRRSAIRLASTPDDHPLLKDVLRAAVGRKTHISPLQRILQYIQHIPAYFEQWRFKDCGQPVLVIARHHFPSADSALMHATTIHSRVKVFTDGARNKDGAGAAAVMRIHDHVQGRTGVRLGSREECTVLEAELAGILLAMQLILRLRYVEDATIFSDSQLAVACLDGVTSGAPRDMLRAVQQAIKRIRDRSDCTGLEIKWCPAHRGNIGNTQADQEARLAAKGEQYPQEFIPRYLENYKPQISHIKCTTLVKEANRELGIQLWRDSTAGKKLLSRFSTVQPENFLRDTDGLNRSQATLLFRLITGHVQTQRHLHHTQVVDTPACQQCGNAQESVLHYILCCPKYADIRHSVLASWGRE